MSQTNINNEYNNKKENDTKDNSHGSPHHQSMKSAFQHCVSILERNHALHILQQATSCEEKNDDYHSSATVLEKTKNVQFPYLHHPERRRRRRRLPFQDFRDAVTSAWKVREERTLALRTFWDSMAEKDKTATATRRKCQLLSCPVAADVVQISRSHCQHKASEHDGTSHLDNLQKISSHDANTNTSNTTRTDSEISFKMMTPLQFKRQYVHRNIPSLILGLDDCEFKSVSRLWRNSRERVDLSDEDDGEDIVATKNTLTQSSESSFSSFLSKDVCICTQWFRENVGDETLVPVREQLSPPTVENSDCDDSENNLGLDDQGRAVECTTVEMAMKSWIDLMSLQQQLQQRVLLESPEKDTIFNQSTSVHDNKSVEINNLYLKDWHLQKFLEEKCMRKNTIHPHSTSSPNSTTAQSIGQQLYPTPRIFTHDLLNNFLLSYARNDDDYRFVYWGPSGSCTPLHSDVLHSFSWSYNVIGRKKWTFYPPSLSSFDSSVSSHPGGDTSSLSSSPVSFEVIQKTGETVFVPSGWKHKVINLSSNDDPSHEMETATLSINHNWITAVSLDQTWHCIVMEMMAVDKELTAWGIAGDVCQSVSEDCRFNNGCERNTEAFQIKEEMLKGCCGMNVTGFVLMVLVRMLDLMDVLGLLLLPPQHCHESHAGIDGGGDIPSVYFGTNDDDETDLDNDDVWEEWFDLACMSQILDGILQQASSSIDEQDCASCDACGDNDVEEASSHSSFLCTRHYKIYLLGRLDAVIGSESAFQCLKVMLFVQERCHFIFQRCEMT